MLTARPLYVGETAMQTLAGVIGAEPDVSALPTSTPTAIRALIGRCLTKDPRSRLQAIGEARIAIERAIHQSDTQAPGGAGAREKYTPVWRHAYRGPRPQRSVRQARVVGVLAHGGAGNAGALVSS
jgi:serine/threonine protein kinase